MFDNKRIVFIGPIFHDYHEKIKFKLCELGADVTFYRERSYGLSFKIINNLFNSKLQSFQNSHYKKILKKEENKKVDFLFIVRGFMINPIFLIKFKKYHPSARIIMYQWDSNNTNPFADTLDYVDTAYSFDFEDSGRFSNLEYLPLFYSDDIHRPDTVKKEYDFFFMGWFFPERYEALIKFKQFSIDNNYKLKAFLYMPLSSYIKERLKGNKLDMSVISVRPMNRKEYLDCLHKTKVMVDVSSPYQTGMAMRVIEALASNVKLITNNINIIENLVFDNSKNIKIFDEKAPSIDSAFLSAQFENKLINLLSLEEWLKQIFFGRTK